MLDHSYTYVENLDRQFANAVQEIEKSIAVWYQRFADNNDILHIILPPLTRPNSGV